MRQLIFILSIIPLLIFSQTKNIEINGGIGSTSFNRDGSSFMQLGGSYNYTPKQAPFYFYAGTNLSLNLDYNSFYSRMRIPIGFNFNVGKKVKFILGGGLFPSCILAHNIPDNSSIEKIYRFQIGASGQIGIAINITPSVDITLSFQRNQDLSPIFVAPIYSPGGINYGGKTYSSDHFLKLGVRFPIAQE